MISNNVIIFKQSNNDFVNKRTNTPYRGPYYEYNNKTYAGSKFDDTAPEIVKVGSEGYNELLNNPATATYSALKNVTSSQLKAPTITKLNHNNDHAPYPNYFFVARISDTPYKIWRISQEDFEKLRNNSAARMYIITYIGTYNNKTKTIEDADKDIPGVASFMSNDDNNDEITPIKELAAQAPSKQTRTTTKMDGKLGQVTSNFTFGEAFLSYLQEYQAPVTGTAATTREGAINAGKEKERLIVEQLGLGNNPALLVILKSKKVSITEMKQWNNMIKWLKNHGYQGNPEMDKTDFRRKVLKEYFSENPTFYINPGEMNEDGVLEKVRYVQDMLKVVRKFTIKQASIGLFDNYGRPILIEKTNIQSGQYLVSVDDPVTGEPRTLNLIDPKSPDWKLVDRFMSWAIDDPEDNKTSITTTPPISNPLSNDPSPKPK